MTIDKDENHQGSCLCGKVKYKVKGMPKVVAHCHCIDCQKLTGAGHSTGAMFSEKNLELEGEVGEYKLKSENGSEVTRIFCINCGSPILGKNSDMRGYVTISLGTLENSSSFEPEVIIFARNQKPWDIMDETITAFEAQPNWHPEETK